MATLCHDKLNGASTGGRSWAGMIRKLALLPVPAILLAAADQSAAAENGRHRQQSEFADHPAHLAPPG